MLHSLKRSQLVDNSLRRNKECPFHQAAFQCGLQPWGPNPVSLTFSPGLQGDAELGWVVLQGEEEKLAGWDQHCSCRAMIISQGWNSLRECYKVRQVEQSEMLIRRWLEKKLVILGLEAIFLFNLLQINAWLLGCRVLFLLPLCDTSIWPYHCSLGTCPLQAVGFQKQEALLETVL